MKHRASIGLAVVLLLLLPAAAHANGFTYAENAIGWAMAGAVVGCIVGLLISRATGARGNFGNEKWMVGSGFAAGLLCAFLYVASNLRFFFPSNVGCLPVLALVALAVAAAGALAYTGIIAGIEAARRRRR